MENDQGTHGSYKKFFAMIGTSMVAMFFLMYLNSYEILGHARFSETRLFMTLMMGAAMMVIMLAFMLGMYRSSKVNMAIFLGAGLLLRGYQSQWDGYQPGGGGRETGAGILRHAGIVRLKGSGSRRSGRHAGTRTSLR